MAIVVFDLDNTLVHSRIDFLGIRRVVVRRLVEVGALAEAPSSLRVRSIPEWLALAEAHDAKLGAELWDEVGRFECEGMLHGTVESDVAPTLDDLRTRGYRLAVLSNNSLAGVEEALKRFDLRPCFDLVLARGVVRSLKPDGSGVLQAHDALGGGPTYVVGDSYLDGVAAVAADVGALFIAFRSDSQDLLARGVRPWAWIDALGELPALLVGARR